MTVKSREGVVAGVLDALIRDFPGKLSAKL